MQDENISNDRTESEISLKPVLGNVLHLTLKKKWFDMVASGVKVEEYREIKPYWETRLGTVVITNAGTPSSSKRINLHLFDYVKFRNGYSRNAPELIFECNGITIGKPHPTWTDDKLQKDCFIILLGSKLPKVPLEDGLDLDKAKASFDAALERPEMANFILRD